LLVLWYVLSERGSGWRAIGWTPAWKDLPEGFGLLIVGYLAAIPPVLVFQAAYHPFAGHYLQAKSLESVLGFGISVSSVAFVLINPFFEELIVRAYTMSEVMDLGGSRLLAIVVSVSLQMSYHFYQGVLRSIAIAATFIVFSIYFARTRRIAPIILAHFCFDALALVRGTF
jgi:membrane protease YdiL (CAAX protease family)